MSDTSVRISIELSSELLAQYETQAKREGIPVQLLLAARLYTCQHHTDGRALYFTDTDRQMLESMLDSSVGTPSDALKRIAHALQVTVDGEVIQVSPAVLERLKARAVRVDPKRYIREVIVKQLEHYVGLR